MMYKADGVMVVGSDDFLTKDGSHRYSLLLANGQGQPHKVSCTFEQMSYVQNNPLTTLYSVDVNVNTVGYNAFADLLEIEIL